MYVSETQVYSAWSALNAFVIVGRAVDTIVCTPGPERTLGQLSQKPEPNVYAPRPLWQGIELMQPCVTRALSAAGEGDTREARRDVRGERAREYVPCVREQQSAR